jgi:hypothetical protein
MRSPSAGLAAAAVAPGSHCHQRTPSENACSTSTFPTTTKIARILESGRKRRAADRTPYLPVVYHHSRDWAGCTIVMIGLLDAISTSRWAGQVGSFGPYNIYVLLRRTVSCCAEIFNSRVVIKCARGKIPKIKLFWRGCEFGEAQPRDEVYPERAWSPEARSKNHPRSQKAPPLITEA